MNETLTTVRVGKRKFHIFQYETGLYAAFEVTANTINYLSGDKLSAWVVPNAEVFPGVKTSMTLDQAAEYLFPSWARAMDAITAYAAPGETV